MTLLQQSSCGSRNWKRAQWQVYTSVLQILCTTSRHACALNTEPKAEKKEELFRNHEELGGTPTSLSSDALEETELAEDAQDRSSEQGQYYCVCILLPSTTPGT